MRITANSGNDSYAFSFNMFTDGTTYDADGATAGVAALRRFAATLPDAVTSLVNRTQVTLDDPLPSVLYGSTGVTDWTAINAQLLDAGLITTEIPAPA